MEHGWDLVEHTAEGEGSVAVGMPDVEWVGHIGREELWS